MNHDLEPTIDECADYLLKATGEPPAGQSTSTAIASLRSYRPAYTAIVAASPLEGLSELAKYCVAELMKRTANLVRAAQTAHAEFLALYLQHSDLQLALSEWAHRVSQYGHAIGRLEKAGKEETRNGVALVAEKKLAAAVLESRQKLVKDYQDNQQFLSELSGATATPIGSAIGLPAFAGSGLANMHKSVSPNGFGSPDNMHERKYAIAGMQRWKEIEAIVAQEKIAVDEAQRSLDRLASEVQASEERSKQIASELDEARDERDYATKRKGEVALRLESPTLAIGARRDACCLRYAALREHLRQNIAALAVALEHSHASLVPLPLLRDLKGHVDELSPKASRRTAVPLEELMRALDGLDEWYGRVQLATRRADVRVKVLFAPTSTGASATVDLARVVPPDVFPHAAIEGLGLELDGVIHTNQAIVSPAREFSSWLAPLYLTAIRDVSGERPIRYQGGGRLTAIPARGAWTWSVPEAKAEFVGFVELRVTYLEPTLFKGSVP